MKRHAAQHARGHAERHQAERQVDPENQRPVDMFSQKAAEHRPAHRGGREHRADIALVAAALARGNNVGDDGLRERHQPAAAEALEGARQHQLGHAGRQRAGHRARDKNADGDEHQHAPAVDIRELAVERRHRRAGEQIGRHHPGQVADIAEMPADGRQRGGDDGLVERAEEHRQHDAEHDGADFRMREPRAFRARVSRRAISMTVLSARPLAWRPAPLRPARLLRRGILISVLRRSSGIVEVKLELEVAV